MAPRQKDPNAKRNLSAYQRGYRTINLTPAEQKELQEAAEAEGFETVKEYLLKLHKARQEGAQA